MKPHFSQSLFAAALACAFSFQAAQPAQAQPAAALVEVAPVVEKPLSVGKSFTGTAVPTRTSIVGSAVDGRVETADFDEGDLVHMVPGEDGAGRVGQTLVQLRTRTIGLELAEAEAELELRKQELAQLEESIPQEIAQAKAKILASAALMDYQQSRYKRVSELYETGAAASKEELDEAKSAWVAAEQDHEEVKLKLEELEATREARLGQARAKLLGQQETVNRVEDIRKKYTIHAPFDGFVIKQYTEVGAWVSRGDPVAEVIELDPVEIEVFVPEHHIAKIKPGDSVSITINALPDRVFVGAVARIVPQADLRSRSFPVKIRLENPNYEIKAGMLVTATIAVGEEKPSLLVPKDALVLNGRQRSVVVAARGAKSGQSVARVVPVEAGIAVESSIQVTGDLKAGDLVVVRGNERLRPGQPLKMIQDKPGSPGN